MIKPIKILLSPILSATMIVAPSLSKANSNKNFSHIVKIRSENETGSNARHVGFQVLKDKSIWFFSCQEKVCKPILNRPIPNSKFQAFMSNATQYHLSQNKKPQSSILKDFALAGLVTYMGTGITAGIAAALNLPPAFGPFLPNVFVITLEVLGAPVILVSEAFGLGAVLAVDTATLLSLAAIGMIAIAAVGAIAYTTYRYVDYRKNKSESENTLILKISHDELVNAILELDKNMDALAAPLP